MWANLPAHLEKYAGAIRDLDRDRLRVVLKPLGANINAIFSIDLGAAMLLSLKRDQDALGMLWRALEAKRVSLSVYNGGLVAGQDVAIKAAYVQANKKDTVEVKVNTLDKSGQNIPNCTVWYKPYLSNNDGDRRKFDKFSTPTTELIPPGRWQIWSEKDRKAGRVDPLDIGDDQRAKREVDIEAPS